MVRMLPLLLYFILLILLPASLTMYQRARKLEDVITDATSFVSLAETQLEALSVATNALSLVDEKSAWIVMPVMPDAVSDPTYCFTYGLTLSLDSKTSKNFKIHTRGQVYLKQV